MTQHGKEHLQIRREIVRETLASLAYRSWQTSRTSQTINIQSVYTLKHRLLPYIDNFWRAPNYII